jgi:hypothetical protein
MNEVIQLATDETLQLSKDEVKLLSKEDAKVEYIDVSSNLRHWNTLRFAELTIFIAATGALMNVVFAGKVTQPMLTLLKVAGALVTLLFLILQERTMAWFYRFLERAAELEEVLGFYQYRQRPQGHRITGRVSIRLFFIVIILFWISSIFLHY